MEYCCNDYLQSCFGSIASIPYTVSLLARSGVQGFRGVDVGTEYYLCRLHFHRPTDILVSLRTGADETAGEWVDT